MMFASLPPAVNSGRMYTGPGAESMLVAASAWETVAGELYTTAVSVDSMICGLISGPWWGATATAPAAAAAAAAPLPRSALAAAVDALNTASAGGLSGGMPLAQTGSRGMTGGPSRLEFRSLRVLPAVVG